MALKRMKITNGATRTKAFKVFGGTEDVRPGETRVLEIEISDSEAFAARMRKLVQDGVVFQGPDAPDVPAGPTREQLEEQAAELGVEFRPNIGDANLAARIEEASVRAALLEQARELEIEHDEDIGVEDLRALIAAKQEA